MKANTDRQAGEGQTKVELNILIRVIDARQARGDQTKVERNLLNRVIDAPQAGGDQTKMKVLRVLAQRVSLDVDQTEA